MVEVEHIIGNIVEACKDTGNILSIVDNGNGTYTVTTDYLYLTYENKEVVILGTTNFDGSYFVSDVDIDNKTFTITKPSGLPTETGTFKFEGLYYTFDKHIGLTNILQNIGLTQTSQNKRFARFYLEVGFPKKFNGFGHCIVDNLTLYIILNSVEKKYVEWRIENTMEYLERVKQVFMHQLKNKNVLKNLGYIKHTKTNLYYQFISKDKNLTNNHVDAIKLELKDLIFHYKQKCLNINF
jgi:hypothetical protein